MPSPDSFPTADECRSGTIPTGGLAPDRISLEAEVPEVLFDGMKEFLCRHPDWDQYSVITSALAGFLFQNGCDDRWVTNFYLDRIFQVKASEGNSHA